MHLREVFSAMSVRRQAAPFLRGRAARPAGGKTARPSRRGRAGISLRAAVRGALDASRLAAATAIAVVCVAPLPAQTTPQVRIPAGRLEGLPLRGAPQGAAFLGIPFSAQPVGDLRWRAPQPAPHWSGVRQATSYGPACMQTPSGWLPEMLGIRTMHTSEACLYLNVWTPKLQSAARLPVFVWVHGGGNVEGSGEWPPLGATLAKRGIVVVSLNYRLGVFGFFSSAALNAESSHRVSGNYGQLDQIAALRWVRDNIRFFGGDPARVTVGGQSSGSLDVCNLMAAPLARGLFRGAILQSGACVDSITASLKGGEEMSARLVSDLSLPAGASMARLRAVPAERLLQAAAADKQIDLEPVIDGWLLPQQPALVFADGRQAAIPVLVGSTRDEVSIFASPLVHGSAYRPQTLAAYHKWLKDEFGGFADQVFAAYAATSDSQVPRIFRRMFTDYDFAFGAYLLAKENADAGLPAYLYNFDAVGSGPFASLGAFHSEENMFLSQRYWTSWVKQPSDGVLSNAMIGYWVNFIQSGSPDGSGLPLWPRFSADRPLCQRLGKNIGPEAVPQVQRLPVFQRFLNARLQAWKAAGR